MMRLRLWLLNLRNRHWYYRLRYHPVTRWVERVVYCHHNARVIADFEDRMSFVLWSCTKGMSKPYYDKHSMVAEIESWSQDACDDAVREALEAHGITEGENESSKPPLREVSLFSAIGGAEVGAVIGHDMASGPDRTAIRCGCGHDESWPAGGELPRACGSCGLAFNWPSEWSEQS